MTKEEIKAMLLELMEEADDDEAPLEFEDDADVNRMLQEDRTPAHSGTEPGMLVTEYGANKAINAHMNRQLFGALSKGKARRGKKIR